MTKLNWDVVGERFYETGVDHVVLYVAGIGVAWNGLTSVSESPNGGEPVPYYLDGFKYLNLSAAEEFNATIQAFSSPPEFSICDGTAPLGNGLFITEQPRKSFDLCYRTKIGNDVDGADHGYKLHLIYNALAAPSTRDNSTVSESIDPKTLSWAITTTPPLISLFKPSAHFVIDSTKTSALLMAEVEDILYGSVDTSPGFPTPDTLVNIFNPIAP